MRILSISLIVFLSIIFSQTDDLLAAESFSCYSDQAATTGFYPVDVKNDIVKSKRIEMKMVHYPLKKQSSGGGSQIRLEGEIATVFDEFTKETYQYQVVAREDNRIILSRQKSAGVETITINPNSGTFVQTDVVIIPLYQRTNVWVGYCR